MAVIDVYKILGNRVTHSYSTVYTLFNWHIFCCCQMIYNNVPPNRSTGQSSTDLFCIFFQTLCLLLCLNIFCLHNEFTKNVFIFHGVIFVYIHILTSVEIVVQKSGILSSDEARVLSGESLLYTITQLGIFSIDCRDCHRNPHHDRIQCIYNHNY